MADEFDVLPADIPLPPEVLMMDELMRKHTGHELFPVGGAVRDFLFQKFHEPAKPFLPKDIDLATESLPWEVSSALHKGGIKVFPKGESFGVISAVIGGKEFEIATFREEWYDPTTGDGRRPDKVAYSTPANDARRRDLTMNALFYDIQKKEIRDYNLNAEGKGQGFEDIVNKVARPVGDAAERFREDRLRVLRLVRFFCKYNPGQLVHNISTDVLEAIIQWRGLPGISPERIANEFLMGLEKCIHPGSYLLNYASLNLFQSVFPGLKVRVDLKMDDVPRNPRVLLAWMLAENEPKKTREGLNRLKYSSDTFGRVEFLQQLLDFKVEKVAEYLRKRDVWKQIEDPFLKAEKGQEMYDDIRTLGRVAGMEAEMKKFLAYEPQAKAIDFMHLGGAGIGKAMREFEAESYRKF
jgi:tRNA nucleotidyltransferase/poly(A) polymerase